MLNGLTELVEDGVIDEFTVIFEGRWLIQVDRHTQLKMTTKEAEAFHLGAVAAKTRSRA